MRARERSGPVLAIVVGDSGVPSRLTYSQGGWVEVAGDFANNTVRPRHWQGVKGAEGGLGLGGRHASYDSNAYKERMMDAARKPQKKVVPQTSKRRCGICEGRQDHRSQLYPLRLALACVPWKPPRRGWADFARPVRWDGHARQESGRAVQENNPRPAFGAYRKRKVSARRYPCGRRVRPASPRRTISGSGKPPFVRTEKGLGQAR